MGALCFVTLFGVVGAKPLPLGEPAEQPSVESRTERTLKPCVDKRLQGHYNVDMEQSEMSTLVGRYS